MAGLAGGPLLGWAGWTVRRGRGNVRAVAEAVIAMVTLGEALWLGLALHYWGEAAVFMAVGALLTALLTIYLARAGVQRYWLCAVLAPVGGLAFYLAEEGILDGLLGSVYRGNKHRDGGSLAAARAGRSAHKRPVEPLVIDREGVGPNTAMAPRHPREDQETWVWLMILTAHQGLCVYCVAMKDVSGPDGTLGF
ncbi:DUF6518 family protein [Streptomyces sp. NPDC048825]|uniref:DUF6518 family protein n=1 Tax=Streptomyces sp. NPDC048825 TaxID=3365592 RepID=UPI003718343A